MWCRGFHLLVSVCLPYASWYLHLRPWEGSFSQLPSNRTKTAWMKKRRNPCSHPVGRKNPQPLWNQQKMVLSCPLGMIPQDHEFTKTDFQKKIHGATNLSPHIPFNKLIRIEQKLGLFWGCQVRCCPPNLIFHVFILWHLTLLAGFSLFESRVDQLPVFPRMVQDGAP